MGFLNAGIDSNQQINFAPQSVGVMSGLNMPQSQNLPAAMYQSPVMAGSVSLNPGSFGSADLSSLDALFRKLKLSRDNPALTPVTRTTAPAPVRTSSSSSSTNSYTTGTNSQQIMQSQAPSYTVQQQPVYAQVPQRAQQATVGGAVGAAGYGTQGGGRILSDDEFKRQLAQFMPQWNTANSQARMAELQRNGQAGGWEYQMLADSLRPGWNVPQGQVAMSAGNQHVNQLMQYANQGVMPSADMLATARYYDDLWNQGGPVTHLPMITSGGQDWSSGGTAPAVEVPYGGHAGGQPETYGPINPNRPSGAGGNYGGGTGGGTVTEYVPQYGPLAPPRTLQPGLGDSRLTNPGAQTGSEAYGTNPFNSLDFTGVRNYGEPQQEQWPNGYQPVVSGQGSPFNQTGAPMVSDSTPIPNDPWQGQARPGDKVGYVPGAPFWNGATNIPYAQQTPEQREYVRTGQWPPSAFSRPLTSQDLQAMPMAPEWDDGMDANAPRGPLTRNDGYKVDEYHDISHYFGPIPEFQLGLGHGGGGTGYTRDPKAPVYKNGKEVPSMYSGAPAAADNSHAWLGGEHTLGTVQTPWGEMPIGSYDYNLPQLARTIFGQGVDNLFGTHFAPQGNAVSLAQYQAMMNKAPAQGNGSDWFRFMQSAQAKGKR